MLWKRVVSAIVGIPIFLGAAYQGKITFLAVIYILTLLALLEYDHVLRRTGCKDNKVLLLLSGLLFPWMFYSNLAWVGPAIFGYILFCFIYYLYKFPDYSPADLGLALLGIAYIAFGFSHLLLLRADIQGFWLVSYVFIVVWSTDTGAYFTGLYLGRHKLSPVISPKKTWEGFAGGLLFSIFAVFIFTYYTQFDFDRTLLLITPFISLSGQLGDLFESALKRYARIKDSGRIIPGHGGVLDRFDSALWAGPLTYYLLTILERL